MTGEVTDRFNEITLFGMALFWQKATEFFTKFIIHYLTYRVERLFNPEFFCLLVLQISFRLGGIWIVGSQVDWGRSMRHASKLIGGRGLFDGSSHLINSVNKSSRIKRYVYSESDKTLHKLVAIQLMK